MLDSLRNSDTSHNLRVFLRLAYSYSLSSAELKKNRSSRRSRSAHLEWSTSRPKGALQKLSVSPSSEPSGKFKNHVFTWDVLGNCATHSPQYAVYFGLLFFFQKWHTEGPGAPDWLHLPKMKARRIIDIAET